MRDNPQPAQQRQQRGINENYARELMELHTLGVDGGYTQKDIIEVAKCFTGWTIADPRGYRRAAADDDQGHEDQRIDTAAATGRRAGRYRKRRVLFQRTIGTKTAQRRCSAKRSTKAGSRTA